MKPKDILILVLLACVVLAWQLSRHVALIENSQQSAAARIADLESRLLPLEKDFNRRLSFRAKATAAAKTAFRCVCGRIGF